MFSGIGGFELGIGGGAECVGYSEINKNAIKIYGQHFKHRNFGDATAIIPEQIPDFDLLVGGFPCQSFSRGGKRRGYEDSRGTLFFDVCRIAKAKRPKYMLLENVAALLDHDGGKTFETILYSLDELGYDASWRVFQRTQLHVVAANVKGTEQTIPLDLSGTTGNRDADLATREQEDMRSAERIIRAFAGLPDWMDSWDSLYPPEIRPRKLSKSKRH